MKLKPNPIATASFLAALLCSSVPVFSGEAYEEEYDRFDGTRTAQYDPTLGSECRLDKALKGSLYACLFMHSTESFSYPVLGFFKKSKGWDLLSSNSKEEANAIITYSNGVVKRRKLPVSLSTDTIYGGTVSETVYVYLRELKGELTRIKKLELQFFSAEFSWIPDQDLVSKVLSYVAN